MNHKQPEVGEPRHQESVRLLSELLDQAAELLGIPEKDRGDPDTFLDAIEMLRDAHAQQQQENRDLRELLADAYKALDYAWERVYFTAEGVEALKQPYDLQVLIDATNTLLPYKQAALQTGEGADNGRD